MNYHYPPSKSVDTVKLIYSEKACVNIFTKKKKMQCTELTCTFKKVLKAKWKQLRSLKVSSWKDQLAQCPSYSQFVSV